MWMLRTLKKYGASDRDLVDVYIQQIRSVIEMACPVWNAGVTQQEVRSLERVQKTALAIIRGASHTNYAEALKFFNLGTLEKRREDLCIKFALKAFKNPKFSNWFVPNESEVNTRSIKLPLKSVKTRTKRFKDSPIPYLTELLNKQLVTQKLTQDNQWNQFLSELSL